MRSSTQTSSLAPRSASGFPTVPHAVAIAAASFLALAAGSAAAQSSTAPTAAPEAKPVQNQLDTVVISGIRASKEKSLNAKRFADGVTEVVSAEDIGKMPDKNVADALQKLPGVTTTAGSGGQGGYDENDRVSMRGTNPSLSLTTINGHSVASADWDPGDQIAGGTGSNSSGAARSVSFLLLPSEIVSQVVVRKSASADQLEGGVAGSVDIITRRPLEFKKRFSAEIGLQGVYADQAGKTDPQFNALFNWKNEANDTGLMLQVFDQTRHIRRDGQSEITWARLSPATPAGQANSGQLGNKLYISGLINSLFEQKRQRQGAVLGAEFKVSPDLTVNLDAFHSELKASYTNTRFFMRPGNSVAASGGVLPSEVSLDGDRINAARFNNTGNAMGAQLETQANPLAASKTQYLNADFNYRASEALSFKGQVGHTRAQGDTFLYWNYAFLPNTATAYSFQGMDKLVQVSLPNGFDGSKLSYLPGNSGADNSFSQQRSKDRENYGQIDGEYRFAESSLISALKFGARMAEHEREGSRPVKGAAPMNAAKNGQVALTSLPAWGGASFPSNFGSGLGGNPGGVGVPLIDPAAVVAWSDANFSADPVFNRPVSGVFTVKENVSAAYGLAKLARDDWRAEFGLRLVRTRTQVTTNTGVPCGAVTASNGLSYGSPAQAEACKGFVPEGASLVTGSRFGNFYIKSTESTDTQALPSASFSYDLSDKLLLRVAAAKVMARPDYSALGSTLSAFAYNPANNPPSTAAGGNAELKPVVAKNYNLGLEWYFARRSVLSAQVFVMDFDSLIGAGSSMQQQLNTAIPVALGGPAVVPTLVSSPAATTGRSRGLELGYEQPVWGGFGVSANYTYANAKEANGNPMLGASKNSYNLGAYYEDEAFSARLAYAHRSASRVGLYGLSQNYLAASGTLAASANYKLNDTVTLTFEGLNLNKPVTRFYNAANATVPFDATTALYSSGRQFYLGLRLKY